MSASVQPPSKFEQQWKFRKRMKPLIVQSKIVGTEIFVDTIDVLFTKAIGKKALKRLKELNKDKPITYMENTYKKLVMEKGKMKAKTFVNQYFPKRALIQRPTRSLLLHLSRTFPDHALDRVDVACDFITATLEEAHLVAVFLRRHQCQKHHGERWSSVLDFGITDTPQTAYGQSVEQAHTANGWKIYSDKPSKINGQSCAHLEFSVRGTVPCRKASIANASELLNTNLRDFAKHRIDLRRINPSKLESKIYEQARITVTERRKKGLRDCPMPTQGRLKYYEPARPNLHKRRPVLVWNELIRRKIAYLMEEEDCLRPSPKNIHLGRAIRLLEISKTKTKRGRRTPFYRNCLEKISVNLLVRPRTNWR